MKDLVLIRHAKSNPASFKLEDFERTLNERGQQEALELGKRLREAKHTPDCLVSSSALRALQTAEVIAEAIGVSSKDIVTMHELYLASCETWFTTVRGLSDDFNSVMFLGHNPGITEFANALSAGDIENIPTAGTVHVQFDSASWQDVAVGSARLVLFDYPQLGRR